MTEGRVFSRKERRLVLFASSAAIFTTPLMATMVNSAIPTIGSDLGVGTHNQAWITVSFLLATVCFLLVWSRIADIWGKRKVFIAGLFIVMFGGLLSSLSPNFALLLVFRMIMGIGAAAISCTSVALITEVYPRSQRGTAFGINTAAVYVGSSVGPGLGGVLTDTLGWHSTFYMIIPFCIIALIPILMFKTEFATAKGEPLDRVGPTIFGSATVLLTIGMLNIPQWWSILSIIIGTLLMVVFYRHQKRERYPVLNVEVFASRMYKRSVIAAFLNYASSYAISFFAVLYLQDVNGWSPSKAGMLLLIQPIIQAVFTPLMGRLSDKISGHVLPTVGMAVLCVGLMIILVFPTQVSMLMIVSALIMLGAGYAMFSAPNTNVVMSSVGTKLYSEAAATLSMMRQTGMLLSMGIASACIALTLGNTAHISENIPAFMNAMRAAILIFVGLSIVGTLLSWFRGSSEETVEA